MKDMYLEEAPFLAGMVEVDDGDMGHRISGVG